MVEEGSPAERAGDEPAPQDGDLGEVRGGEEELAEAEVQGDGRDVLRDVLEYLARNLVEIPDAVEVTVDEDDRGTVLRLRVDPEDMGKVIGRGGRMARAIRTVVRAAGTRSGVSAYVDIVD
jgi:predicted RNA-binding protein YlqC (UPF0109 family)